MARFKFTNNRTLDIREVFIYPEASWDPNNNLLSAGETISNGSVRLFEVIDGTYDVLFTLTNGTRFRKQNVPIFGDTDENTDEYDLLDEELN